MARSQIAMPSVDINSDSGAVLWSLVQGEQLEFPVQLAFIPRVTNDYVFEAVVLEAQDETTVRPGGHHTTLNVKVPPYRGAWSGTEVYYYDDVVAYGNFDWRYNGSAPYTSTTTPDVNPKWVKQEVGTVFVQFPSTLGSNWTIQPTVTQDSYGFFELRITEPPRNFTRTWKPVRGMVKLIFSPTGVI